MKATCKDVAGDIRVAVWRKYRTLNLITEVSWRSLSFTLSVAHSWLLFNRYGRRLWRTSTYYVLFHTRPWSYSSLDESRAFSKQVLQELKQ